ncbi:MAG: MerR family transcriptional regulator [Ignavibacteriae bacterium]|nr:MerR family transcriptional regulator [Ignavibacteriota bacterium]MCB9217133.1 MerR family transcriptional regulator [Ignavibacteria bacterium]
MKDLEMKKLYYSISEVSKMVDLEQYVLRYWEREFSQLRPQKNRAGNRIYTEKDIEIIRLIKRLTREDRYTISGARQVLEQLTFDNGMPILPDDFAAAPVEIEQIDTLADDLKNVRTTLVKLLDKLRNGSSTV